jgi:tetratricopeptide (TPR) repeat protein
MDPSIDPGAVAPIMEEGVNNVPEELTDNLEVLFSHGNTVSGAILSFGAFTARGLAQNKIAETVSFNIQTRMEELADKLDEDQPLEARMIRGIHIVMRCLPGDDWEKGTMQLINGNPDAFISLLETYTTNPQKREELEKATEQVISADPDILLEENNDSDVLDFLKRSFGVDNRDDALQQFLNVRRLLISDQIHSIIETTEDVNININDLSQSLKRTREDLKTNIDKIRMADLRNQGFVRLNPYYFEEHEPARPATCWRTGFNLPAVHAGFALERQNPKSEDRRKVWRELHQHLTEGESLVVLGRPGTGKSTICKNAACHWYKNRHGAVFYRESNTGQRLTEPGVLNQYVREAEGHVLVVVEDAARESTTRILKLVKEFEDNGSVSFLLDSRIEEWKSLTMDINDPHLFNLKQELPQYRVPNFDEIECARALTLFERSTDRNVVETPQQLLDHVETDMGVGEMYLLGYKLSTYDFRQPIESTDMTNEIKELYNDIAGRDDRLAKKVGITINILNAAEIGIYPEVLQSLGNNKTEYTKIDELINEFTGRLIFERERRYQSHHPFWSAQYLSYALERDGHHAIHLFEESVNSIFNLIEDQKKRMEIRQWYRSNDLDYLDKLEEEAGSIADSVVQDVFRLGLQNPGIADLYNTTRHTNISIPEDCSPKITLECIKWRGEMHLEAGNPDTSKEEFEYLLYRANGNDELSDEQKARLIGQGYLNLGEFYRKQGELDSARRKLEESINVFEKIKSDRWKAQTFAELGVIERRSGNLNKASDHYNKSIELCREVDYRYGEAKALNNRGMVKKDRGKLEEARQDLERAIKLKRDSHNQASQAISENTIGEILYEQGKLGKAKNRLERSLRMKQEIKYRSGIAWSLYYIGLVELECGRLTEAKENMIESLSIRRNVDDELGIGRCLNTLGCIYNALNDLDRAKAYHEWSLEKIENVGDELGKARYEMNVGEIYFKKRDLPEATKYFENAIDKFTTIENNRGLADAYRGRAKVERKLENHREALEYYQTAENQMDQLPAPYYHKKLLDEIIEACEEGNLHVQARKYMGKREEVKRELTPLDHLHKS